MTIEDKQKEITEEFADIEDWLDRYAVSYTHLTLPTIRLE